MGSRSCAAVAIKAAHHSGPGSSAQALRPLLAIRASDQASVNQTTTLTKLLQASVTLYRSCGLLRCGSAATGNLEEEAGLPVSLLPTLARSLSTAFFQGEAWVAGSQAATSKHHPYLFNHF